MVYDPKSFVDSSKEQLKNVIRNIDKTLEEASKKGVPLPFTLYNVTVLAPPHQKHLVKAALDQYRAAGWVITYREATDQRDEDSITFSLAGA